MDAVSYSAFREETFQKAERVLIVAGYAGQGTRDGGPHAVVSCDENGPLYAVKSALFAAKAPEDVILYSGDRDGILASFYRFTETFRRGLVVFQEAIPIDQRDLESAEDRGEDLFFLPSENVVLIELPKDASIPVVKELTSRGIASAVAGAIVPFPKKELWRLGRRVYLKRPGRME